MYFWQNKKAFIPPNTPEPIDKSPLAPAPDENINIATSHIHIRQRCLIESILREATRFCTFTTAMLGSEPCLKLMVMVQVPLLEASSGTTTLFITVSALAPV